MEGTCERCKRVEYEAARRDCADAARHADVLGFMRKRGYDYDVLAHVFVRPCGECAQPSDAGDAATNNCERCHRVDYNSAGIAYRIGLPESARGPGGTQHFMSERGYEYDAETCTFVRRCAQCRGEDPAPDGCSASLRGAWVIERFKRWLGDVDTLPLKADECHTVQITFSAVYGWELSLGLAVKYSER